MELKIINPIHYPNWDEMILKTKEYSLFHSSAWAKVLSETYNYVPQYFSMVESEKLKVLIPLMTVNSWLTGSKAVSLPFTDHCPVILNGQVRFESIIDYLGRFGTRSGWRYIELRNCCDMAANITPSTSYYNHEVDLNTDEADLYKKFRSSTKRNIKKAISKGVHTKIGTSLSDLNEYYRLHCITRKRQGVPPQPLKFFRNIHKHIISKKLGFIVFGTYENKNISGMVFFHFGKKAIYKYGASDKRFQQVRANNLVMWDGIKWFIDHGYENLDLGRTEFDNNGLRQFKMGWAAKESRLIYNKYHLASKSYIVDDNVSFNAVGKVVNVLPIGLLKIIGNVVYRHIG